MDDKYQIKIFMINNQPIKILFWNSLETARK